MCKIDKPPSLSMETLKNMTPGKDEKWNIFSNFKYLQLQSVSWSLAEFRHNKIVQLLRENCFNVCRQLQRKVTSRKHDV